MKKFICIIFICIFTLVACKGNQVPLPTLPNMEFVEISHQPNEENDYTTAVYTIKNTTREEVTEEYIKILENDSWDVTFINKPLLIEATKGNKETMIFLFNEDNDVYLTVLFK
ncbi:hypothetical protein [Tissierella praeacuta]|uniref:hypothetical protein n=1 Tax=Tissierella praeacuta TaxID=43131 RepID=UPI00333FF16B